jgi:hypothetical protein
MKTTLVPSQAKNFSQVCQLPTDNAEYGDAWIILDWPSLVIKNQKLGEASTGSVTLSKRQFNRFVKWWQTGK